MADFPCPYCGHAVDTESSDEPLSSCTSCDGSLLIAYRYRLVGHRGELSGGELYEARDDGFDERMAVLFAARDADAAALARFVEGNRLFAELGGGRGLVRIYEVGGHGERRPYVVMDWVSEGTLESRVMRDGPLDMPTLVETAGDLLTGLAKGHRAMPNVVHNHVHPGKIGFLSDDEIVMFGFEWATQVFEQDSTIADAFIDDAAQDVSERRAEDLRQLGVALFYAATGEWIGDASNQREQARARMQGPLALLVDRLLDAGASGYRTAVDAVMDLDCLLRGELDSWRPRILPKQKHGGDVTQSVWKREPALDMFRASETAGFEQASNPHFYSDAEPRAAVAATEDFAWEADAVEELEEFELVAPPALPGALPVSGGFQSPSSGYAGHGAHSQQVQTPQAPAQPAKGGRVLGVIMVMLVGSGMCVAAIGENLDDDYDAEWEAERIRAEIEQMERAREAERLQVEMLEREREMAEPVPAPIVAPRLDATWRYTGTITGPDADQLQGEYRIGDSCEVWVEPSEPQSSLNCRLYIDCKRGRTKRRIYGGGDVGFSDCELDADGRPLRAQDDADDAPDGAFMAEFGGTSPVVVVLDRWLHTPTRVAISLVGEAERWERRVPNVRLATRLDRDTIEGLLAASEQPDAAEPADVSDGDGELPEQLSHLDIREVFQAAQPALAACGAPSGLMLTFELSVSPAGEVERAQITPPLPPQYAGCLGEVLDGLQFPAAREPMGFSFHWQP